MEALAHREPDRVPIDSWFTPPILQKLCNRFGVRDEDELRVKLDLDLITLQVHVTEGTFKKKTRPDGNYEDEFGILWNKPDYRDFLPKQHPIRNPEQLDDFTFPETRSEWRYKVFCDYVEKYGEDFPIFGGIGFTLFERAWVLRGFTALLSDILRNPEFVDRLFDKILEYDIGLAREIVRTGIDVFYVGDDYGAQQGTIISPAQWKRLVKPRLQKLLEVPRSRGLKVALHSCGNITEIVPDLIEAGVDILNPVQSSVLDPVSIKEKFGDRLTLWGSVDTQRTMPFGAPSDVESEVRNRLVTLGPNGGLILAPVHTVMPEVSVENYLAFLDAAKRYGRYPASSV